MRILKTAALALLAVPLFAQSARAGSYHVYTCRTPAGESAPVDGWSGSVGPGSATDVYTRNTCPEHGALVAALGDQTSHLVNTDRATWAFEAPAFVRLTSAMLWRAGYLHGASENATYQFWLSAPTATKVFDECLYTGGCHARGDISQPMSAANRLAVSSTNLGPHLFVNVSCGAGMEGSECKGGFGDPYGYAAVVYLYAADFTLEQAAGPSSGNVGGELASAGAVSGTSDLTFTASDPGSGVYQAVFTVDGQVVQRTALDDNGGRCRNVGQTSDGLPAFLYVQPCQTSVTSDVGFDTTRLGNGAHHLVVSVIDAAGNSAPVLARNVTVANPVAAVPQTPAATINPLVSPGGALASAVGPPQPNGANASPLATLTANWTATKLSRLTSRYGRAQTITGRLIGPGGAPIAGAQIDLTTVPAYARAAAVVMPSPHTGQDGRFTVHLPGGVSSRTLRFEYRAHLGDATPVATRSLSLSVEAGVALSVAPHTASVGRHIFFHGRLLGGLIPRGGKQLVLEARAPGGSWLEFHVIRADSRGRYSASYRFKFPGPARYQFRVLSEAESDYPFAPATSNVVAVRER